MEPVTLARLAEATGAGLQAPDGLGDPDDLGGVLVTGAAAVDSRAVAPGDLFVAVAGEHVDGHDFVEAAVAAGAVAVLGTRPTAAPTLVVPDVVRALGRIGRFNAEAVRGPKIALTGSQGKTGVKDYLAQVLGEQGRTVATQGNYNNEIGVPLTVLAADHDTDFLVAEMGARGVGHIGYLCEVLPPDVAAVLNIGTAHLGEFGSRDAIAEAKGEIIAALRPGGVAVVNSDDAYAERLLARRRDADAVRALTFGEHGDVHWREVTTDDLGRPTATLGFHGAEARVTLQQVGRHQVVNAAAALALALAAGLDFETVVAGLGRARALSKWRMEMHDLAGGGLLINDAYNANPDSMRAALETAVGIAGGRGVRAVAVLGEMRELGEGSDADHAAVGRHAAALGLDVLLAVGETSAAIWEGFTSAHASSEAAAPGVPDGPIGVVVSDRDEALAWLRLNRRPDDVIVVKASRAAELERLATVVVEENAT